MESPDTIHGWVHDDGHKNSASSIKQAPRREFEIMTAIYELAILGAPSASQTNELRAELEELVAPFSLALGKEIAWSIAPATFDPSQRHAAAAIFVGAPGVNSAGLDTLLRAAVPIIPVSSQIERFSAEIPDVLRPLNGLSWVTHGARRIATALLECAGLLPRQRRVFVSYRREESRNAALQLFDAFSARLFDVFLDTHGIPPAEDFQSLLWHRLCDSDVLVMIDTPTYFESRWTAAEFGRAQAKSMSILRVVWPGCPTSPRAATAGKFELAALDIEETTGRIAESTISRICYQLEALRSQSVAVRHLNLVSGLQISLERIGGRVHGVGVHKGIHVQLPNGTGLVVYPAIGNPTSVTLHEAAEQSLNCESAVLYDHIGLHTKHLSHLDWLSGYIPKVRLIKACEAAWQLAGWDAR